MRSNCLFWALWRLATEGGYIAMRRSQHCRWLPHFIWSRDLKEWHGLVPLNPKHGAVALLFCWWFRGVVVRETT